MISENEPGIILKIDKVIKHLQELRALGYAILNQVLLGDAQLADSSINDKCKGLLPGLLVKDLQILPKVLELEESTEDN